MRHAPGAKALVWATACFAVTAGVGESLACDGDLPDQPVISVRWLDDITLSVTGPEKREDVVATITVVATCGVEVETWSFAVALLAGESVNVAIPEIAFLDHMVHAAWGVELGVHLALHDAGGRLLELASAPERVAWFDGAVMSLITAEDATSRLGPAVIKARDPVVVDGVEMRAGVLERVLPPVAIFNGVQ